MSLFKIENWYKTKLNTKQNLIQRKSHRMNKYENTNTQAKTHEHKCVIVQNWNSIQEILDKQVEMGHTRRIQTFMKHSCLKLCIKHEILYESSTWNFHRKHQTFSPQETTCTKIKWQEMQCVIIWTLHKILRDTLIQKFCRELYSWIK